MKTIATLLLLATTAGAQTGAVKAFTGATLIDGTDRAPVANATILVRDGRIVAAGPASARTIPAGATALRSTASPSSRADQRARTREQRRTISAPTPPTASLPSSASVANPRRCSRREPRRSTPALDRARVFVAGPVLAPTTPDEARAQVAGVAAQKVDIVKIRVDDNLGTTPKMAPEVYRAVIDEAHKRGLRVAITSLLPRRRQVAARRRRRLHRAQHPRHGRRRGVHRELKAPKRLRTARRSCARCRRSSTSRRRRSSPTRSS